MKSNVKNQLNNSLNRNKNLDILLTIGMIVKNEEKVLERCLKSLQPLMNAIPSELIIADTGSTDSTVEIAKKYTNNVYHYEWINDFAAARNSTLEKANGKWYMFIDADEYFDEDISEVVEFFKISQLCDDYNTLRITIRSYLSKELLRYKEASLPRFFKIYDGIKFDGQIHEGIVVKSPVGYFSTVLHHTGYFFDSTQERAKKRDRNLTLMIKEYEKNPNDLRMICHIISGITNDMPEKEHYVKKGLELALQNRMHLYANALIIQNIEFYKDTNPEYALKLCDEFYKGADEPESRVATVELWYQKHFILAKLSRYEEAYEAFVKYSELYRDYNENKLNNNDLSAYAFDGLSKNEFMDIELNAILILNKLTRYDEAFYIVSKYDLKELKGADFRNYLGTLREICKLRKDYKLMAQVYEEILTYNDKEKEYLALYMLESTYNSFDTKERRVEFATCISESGCNGKYIELMKLVCDEKSGISDRLMDFISSVDDWHDGYSEAIYMAVKNKLDISNMVLKVDASLFRSKLEEIANSNDDFARYVLSYGIPESYMQSIKQFFWILSLYEKASYRCFVLDDEEKYELYSRFLSLLGDYVMNVYNPELLNDDDIEVISNYHKFGYYMCKAKMCLEKGDKIEYIRNMRKALVSCETMKEIVEFLLNKFKESV